MLVKNEQLILSTENVVDFLKQQQICPPDFQTTVPIICKRGKNFNLVVSSSDRQSWLVKQNRIDSQGKTSGNLMTEWLVQELINNFKDLASIQPLISEVVHFDRSNSILVSVFYDEYIALDEYYEKHQSYHPQIAQTIGTNLGQIHRATYKKLHHLEFLSKYFKLEWATKPPGFIRKLNSLNPSIFGELCPDGLDFCRLYQRFPSLNQAIIELYEHTEPACLTHDDLKLNNFIIDSHLAADANLIQIKPQQIKIIDWEFIFWADPAGDLGMLVSQYLAEWLNSLVADPNLNLNTILSLASCPLEKITPSLSALLRGYLTVFPEILVDRPDFVTRVVQFAGIGIIERLSHQVNYHYHFDNDGLCKLQVAKNLLCYPETGINTIFGTTAAELKDQLRVKAVQKS